VAADRKLASAGAVADVPAVVRNKALAVGATQWPDDLPELIASMEREWSIIVGRPYDYATEAFVAEATLEDGTVAVLKLLVPRAGDAAGNEITALRLVNGEGCARRPSLSGGHRRPAGAAPAATGPGQSR
jgi:streptomycin 6-kinase